MRLRVCVVRILHPRSSLHHGGNEKGEREHNKTVCTLSWRFLTCVLTLQMPNWCANRLEVSGDLRTVERFVKTVQSSEDETLFLDLEVFRDYMPSRTSPLVPSLTGKHRQDPDDPMERSGPKQDTKDRKTTVVVYHFSSSWGPPTEETSSAMLKMFPALQFRLYYAEKGQCFVGFRQTGRYDSKSWHREDACPPADSSDEDEDEQEQVKHDKSDGIDWSIFKPLWENSG